MEKCSGDVVLVLHHAHPYHTAESRESVSNPRAVCVNFSLQDDSFGTRAGGAAMGGTVAAHVRSRNSTDARHGTSVERCWHTRTLLRAVLLFDVA